MEIEFSELVAVKGTHEQNLALSNVQDPTLPAGHMVVETPDEIDVDIEGAGLSSLVFHSSTLPDSVTSSFHSDEPDGNDYEIFWPDRTAPFKRDPNSSFFQNLGLLHGSLSQRTRLSLQALFYIFGSLGDLISDILVITITTIRAGKITNAVAGLLGILCVSSINGFQYARDIFGLLSPVTMFSIFGLGSAYFGTTLLCTGFGIVHYQLPYSLWSNMQELRFQESGVESILSVYPTMVNILLRDGIQFVNVFSFVYSISQYSSLMAFCLKKETQNCLDGTSFTLLVLMIMADAGFNSITFATVSIKSHLFSWIAFSSLFVVYASYFTYERFLVSSRRKDWQMAYTAPPELKWHHVLSNTLFSMTGVMPMYKADVTGWDTDNLTERKSIPEILIASRFLFNLIIGSFCGMDDSLATNIFAGFAFADSVMKIYVFGYYWPMLKVIHTMIKTDNQGCAGSVVMQFLSIDRKALTRLCNRADQIIPNHGATAVLRSRMLLHYVQAEDKWSSEEAQINTLFSNVPRMNIYYYIEQQKLTNQSRKLALEVLKIEYNQPQALRTVLLNDYKNNEQMHKNKIWKRINYLMQVDPEMPCDYFINLALHARDANQPIFAIRILQKAVQRGKCSHLMHQYLGEWYMEQGHNIEAAESYERYKDGLYAHVSKRFDFKHQLAKAHGILSVLYNRLGEVEKRERNAIEAEKYEKEIEEEEQKAALEEGGAFADIVDIKKENQGLKVQCEELLKLIKNYPQNEQLRAEVGMIFFEQEKYDMAMTHLHRFQKLESEKIEDGKKPERAISIRPLTLLARLQVNRGYFDEAISHCDLSLKIFRQNMARSRYKLKSETEAADLLISRILSIKGKAHLGKWLNNKNDPDVHRKHFLTEKLYARNACNESIQKKRLPQAHATIALSMIYDKDLEGARRDLKMAKELQHAETRDLDEVRVVEMILILFEGDFEYLEEFEILALQIDSPRWSVEIARRFPRNCIYGRIVLTRLLLLAKLYEWAHFELKELLQLQTISGIEKKFRLFPELMEGLHELWKLIPVEKQEKYEFVLEEGFSMTMPNIFSSLASTPMSKSILPNYKRQLSKFALAEQLVGTRMHLHSS